MVFDQTLNNMCTDAEMVHLFKHFVLCGNILLSLYRREACIMHDTKKETDGPWKDGAFVFIITKKNPFIEYSVATRGVFWTYLWRCLKKLDDLTLKAVKACYDVLFKFYETSRLIMNWQFESTRNPPLLQCLLCWTSQCVCSAAKQYHNMTMDKFADLFQITHSMDNEWGLVPCWVKDLSHQQ